LLTQTVIFLALGFSFWLAVFPFFTWVPLLCQEAPHYETGFILSLLPSVVFLLMLNFLDNYSWLREYPLLTTALRICGVLMVATAGVWAAFQKELPRLFGYAVILENGYAILSIGLQSTIGLEIFTTSLLPRGLSLALWALTLALFQAKNIPLTIEGVRGSLRRYPIISGALVLAYFSLAGLPMLGGFPMKIALLQNLARVSLPLTFWVFVGMMGFLLSGFRLLSALVSSDQQTWTIGEDLFQEIILVTGSAALFLIGIFPKFFLSAFLTILQSFKHL
jgi:NADH-quinone oxidoreductase subunit N